MKTISSPAEMQTISKNFLINGKTVGFVPTMGYLHQGHISLIHSSVKENDITVVSIFVNPLQFGPNEDLDKYPRNVDRDSKLLVDAGVDILYYPQVSDMYTQEESTVVSSPDDLQSKLCGHSRPGHFDGVTTVVAKLFNIVLPDKAYFGLKDYQQLMIIKKMVVDLNFPVKIVSCPIVRESDGLAMSSRNIYLSQKERQQAPIIWQTLKAAAASFDGSVQKSLDFAKKQIESKIENAQVDYIEIYDADNLSVISEITQNVLLAVAVFVNKTRLIDNIVFELK